MVGDVDDRGGDVEPVGLAAEGPVAHLSEQRADGVYDSVKVVTGLGVEGEQLVGRAPCHRACVGVTRSALDRRAEGTLGDAVGPAEDSTDDVGHGVVEGAGADVEAFVELVLRECFARTEDARVGPAVVAEEDGERLGGEGFH